MAALAALATRATATGAAATRATAAAAAAATPTTHHLPVSNPGLAALALAAARALADAALAFALAAAITRRSAKGSVLLQGPDEEHRFSPCEAAARGRDRELGRHASPPDAATGTPRRRGRPGRSRGAASAKESEA